MSDETVSDETVSDETPPVRPLLSVVRGEPTPEQLAALIAVVSSRSAAEPDDPAPRALWATPVLRSPVAPGPGAWRASGLPH